MNVLIKFDKVWYVIINNVENIVDEIEINCQTNTLEDNILKCKAKHVHIGEINNKIKAIII